MSIFVDTAALLAMMDADSPSNRIAVSAWQNLIATEEILVTSS